MWEREFCEAGNGGEGDEGIVAEVHEIAGEDSAGAGADVGESDADKNEERDDAPGPGELRAVEEAEEKAGEQNAGDGAVANGLDGLHTKETENARNDAHQDGIKIAAENGFFDERSDGDGHAHHEHRAEFAFQKEFDGHVVGSVNARADHGSEKRESGAGEKIEPRLGRKRGGGSGAFGKKFTPAERSPKRFSRKNGKRDVEEKKNGGKPGDVGADDELRDGEEILLQFFLRKGFVRSVIKGENGLHEDEGSDTEKDETKKMDPGPGDAEIVGNFRPESVRNGRRRGKRKQVTREWRGDRFVCRRSGGVSVGGRGIFAVLGGIGKAVIEESHDFLALAVLVLGQPEASAAATSGRRSS